MIIHFPNPDTSVPLSDAAVRGRYCDGVYVRTGRTTSGGDFNRWLTQHDRKVAVNALRNAAEVFGENQMIREGDVKEWLHLRADKFERGEL